MDSLAPRLPAGGAFSLRASSNGGRFGQTGISIRRRRWIQELARAPALDTYSEANGWVRQFRERHRADASFTVFDAAVRLWQTDPVACWRMQQDLLAMRGSPHAAALLGALRLTDPAPGALFRGDAEEGSPLEVLARFPPGGRIEIPLASFTSDRRVADLFAWDSGQDDGRTEVVYALREGSRSVRVDVFAPDEIHWREREWYTGGRFVVRNAVVVSGRQVEVTLEQTGAPPAP